jgi:hypothetical protein
VAEDHGLLDDEMPDAAVQPVVDIGAADAGVGDPDDDRVGVGLEGWNRAVFEGDIVGRLEDEGEVLRAAFGQWWPSRKRSTWERTFAWLLLTTLAGCESDSMMEPTDKGLAMGWDCINDVLSVISLCRETGKQGRCENEGTTRTEKQ